MSTEQTAVNLTITESAQDYLAELLAKQDDVIGVRVFITQPGTPKAETGTRIGAKVDLNRSLIKFSEPTEPPNIS